MPFLSWAEVAVPIRVIRHGTNITVMCTVRQTTAGCLLDACGYSFAQSITRGVLTAKGTQSLAIGKLTQLADQAIDVPFVFATSVDWKQTQQGYSLSN